MITQHDYDDVSDAVSRVLRRSLKSIDPRVDVLYDAIGTSVDELHQAIVTEIMNRAPIATGIRISKTIYIDSGFEKQADVLLAEAFDKLPKESDWDVDTSWDRVRCSCGSPDHLDEECPQNSWKHAPHCPKYEGDPMQGGECMCGAERAAEPMKDMDGGYYHAPESPGETGEWPLSYTPQHAECTCPCWSSTDPNCPVHGKKA